MKNLLDLVIRLAQLAATFEVNEQASPELLVAISFLMKYVREQSGMTTDEILARAGVVLDTSEMMLLEDRIRLEDLGVDPPGLAGDATCAGDETKNGY